MPDADFDRWENDPGKFYLGHALLFGRVIGKSCFTGHLDEHKRYRFLEEIRERMNTSHVMEQLQSFQQQSTFLVFYIVILKKEVTMYSQEEDLRLLNGSFNLIMLKYQPLVKQICSRLLEFYEQLKPVSKDIHQQIMANILSRKEKIVSSYKPEHLFKNYFWSIIKNEGKNLVTSELRKHSKTIPLEKGFIGMMKTRTSTDDGLLVQDTLMLLHEKTLAYLHIRTKLIVCLKIVCNVKIDAKDLTALFNHRAGKDYHNKVDKAIDKLEREITSNDHAGILLRFKIVEELLNMAEQAETDAHSYWRWTNIQINHITEYLNNKHMMRFDRDSFNALIDRYFYYYDQSAPKK
jgi:hypothetical protein